VPKVEGFQVTQTPCRGSHKEEEAMQAKVWFVVVVLVVGCIAGCNGDNGGGPGGNQLATAAGFAFKGLVANATVNLYALRSTGARGEQIASGQTDSQGFFNIAKIAYTGWALAVISGGLATNFLGSPSPIDPNFPLYGLMFVQAGLTTAYSVTVLSTLVYYALQAEMLRGGGNLDTNIVNASRRVALMFGITLGLLTLFPSDLTAGSVPASEQANYGAVTAGFCELAINLGIAELQLMHMLGRDILDGLLDGRFFGQNILSSTGSPLSSSVWTVLWPLAITNFLASSFNQSGLSSSDIPAIAKLQALSLLMVAAPLILTLYPAFLSVNTASTVEVRGKDLPDKADAKVTIQGEELDSSNITETSDGWTLSIHPRS